MPNYKFTYNGQTHLLGRCYTLLDKYIATVRSGFPLTHDDVQRCVMDAETLQKCMDLNELGITVGYTGSVQFRMVGKDLKRQSVIQVHLAQTVFCGVRGITHSGEWNSAASDVPCLDSTMVPDKWDALVSWNTELVRATRLAQMARVTCRQFIEAAHDTTTVKMNWPLLATLPIDGTWLARFRATNIPTRAAKKHFVHVNMPPEKQIKVTESLLNMALMLDTPPAGGAVTGSLIKWERLPGDGDF
jgi:hypothetical protein